MKKEDKEFIESLSKEDQIHIKNGIDFLSKATPSQKDEFFMITLLVTIGIVKDLNKVIQKLNHYSGIKKNLNKEIQEDIKEIEDTISLGIPGWIKYTRKTKKNKKIKN